MNEGETKVRKVLFNEVSFIIAVVGAVSSIIFWVQNPQAALKLDIVKLQSQVESTETVTAALQKIKDNDLHEVQLRMDRIEARQIDELTAIARLEALLTSKK